MHKSQQTIKNKSLKVLYTLKNKKGETTTNRNELLKIMEDFYVEANIKTKHIKQIRKQF